VSAHYVFLLGAVAFTALFGYGVYLWWKSSQVTTENIERKVRQWTDAFGFPSRVLNDDKLHFGLQVELPSRVHVAIRRQKDRPSYLTLINRIVMSDKQRAVFDKMSEEEQGSCIERCDWNAADRKLNTIQTKNWSSSAFISNSR